MAMPTSAFIDKLSADGPASEHAAQMGLYGWLIGDWTFDAAVRKSDGTQHQGRGEIHFGWVLEGRAIQDVWILPGVFYGTTLRVYDPEIDAWHILWNDPLKQLYTRQIGRAHGRDIVQLGNTEDGASLRWTFADIAPNSFRWLGERLSEEGATWRREAEFQVRRRGA